MVKIIFVQKIWFPLEGVMALSAALKKAGHRTRVAVGDEKKVIKEIKAYKPDIIAFPVITSFRKFTVETSRRIKENGIKSLIITGGYDITFSPEIIKNSSIDIICRGEGEGAIVDLANALERKEDYKNIKNLWVKKNRKIIKNDIRPFEDINKRLMRDRDIYRRYDLYFKDIEFEQISAGRGCPYDCSYCFNHKYRQVYTKVDHKYCALRDVDNVIEECLFLKRKYRIKNIIFMDSTFTYNKRWVLKFLKKYREKVNLPFSINATAKELDEDICKALTRTKCYMIRIGLETGNEKLRKEVLRKDISNKDYIKVTNLLKKYKIRYQLNVMFDLPGETLENALETLDFVVKLSSNRSAIGISVFKPYPKLDLTEYGIGIGEFKRDKIKDINLIGDEQTGLFESLREQKESRAILNLSRLGQLYVHFPFLRRIIRNKLIYYPDNLIYRFIFQFGEYVYTARGITNASFGYLLKYVFKYMHRKLIYA